MRIFFFKLVHYYHFRMQITSKGRKIYKVVPESHNLTFKIDNYALCPAISRIYGLQCKYVCNPGIGLICVQDKNSTFEASFQLIIFSFWKSFLSYFPSLSSFQDFLYRFLQPLSLIWQIKNLYYSFSFERSLKYTNFFPGTEFWRLTI